MEFTDHYLIYFLLAAAAVVSVVTKKLTIAGGITGFIVAAFIFKGVGYPGIEMLALFFVMGSVATGWKASKKQEAGLTESGSSRRTTGQVIANGGIAALLGGLAWYWPGHSVVLNTMIAGSFASATADTLSSELDSICGTRFYDILTFKKVAPGPDGVVSLEGTLIGIVGSAFIALIYIVNFGYSYSLWIIIIAGAIGNLSDSILGATLERKNLIGNNVVNFLNTAIGAGICFLLSAFVSRF